MGCSPPGSSVHGIPQQEYWRGLPFPPPGDLLNPGIELVLPALVGGFFTTEPPGKPFLFIYSTTKIVNKANIFMSILYARHCVGTKDEEIRNTVPPLKSSLSN